MTTKQEDKLSMEIVVVDFLNNTDPSILALMPQINTLKEKFSTNVNKLRTFKNGQTLNRTGNRIAKDQLREQMTQLGFTTAAKVCAYAIAINNEVLEIAPAARVARQSVAFGLCHDAFLSWRFRLPNRGMLNRRFTINAAQCEA